jgi:hypothetical protein
VGSDRLTRIGRLAAVARGLEREGVYNGAKLARAALQRELLLEADSRLAELGAGLVDEAVDLADELTAQDGDAFAAGLIAAAHALHDGTTLSLAEAPPAHTCRSCGALFVGPAIPRSCPTCEAPDSSFLEHLPVWYLEPADAPRVLDMLAETPRRIEEGLSGHDDADLGLLPAPGEWSARDTLEHLVSTEQLLAERVARLLSEADPDLQARAMWAETVTSDEASVRTGEPATVLLARYLELRGATLERLGGLDERQWQRSGRHPEWGRVTVLSQAAYFARHETSHLAQLLAATEGRVPGRPRLSGA